MFNHLQVEVEGQIATIRLDRLDALNALDADLVTELIEAISGLDDEHELRAFILASNHPKAFVAGADIGAMAQMSALERSRFAELGHELMRAIERSPLVAVAAVNGYCLGGGLELALACDLIYAGPQALFGFPEVTLGLVPGFGGTQRFVRSVGLHRALGYILTGRRFGAEEAAELGFVWRVIDHADDFLVKVMEDVVELCKNGPLALEAAKRLVRQATWVDLETGASLEVGAFGAIGASEDATEGLRAFLEKRAATFHRR